MPTVWKRIVFSVGSVLSLGSVALLVVALSTERWITGTILCQTGVDLVNASSPELSQFTGDIYYGLFQGGKTRKCGLGSRRYKIYIFPRLIRKVNGGLHMIIIFFHFIAIGFALVSLAFCIYNARKVPYQSIKGPLGLYLWNFIAAFFSSLGFACFIAAVRCHRLTERVANFRENLFHLVVLEENLGFSFWLCVASTVTHGVNILVVASSRIHLPKLQTKKPEEPTITGDDLLY
ncbi:clarin-2 [Pygocentrus nattereri]|uniref:Clarin 2 n=1 Tax=Pygocentrus nattereri TaxID=42514 RepID=A0AAR2KWN6_PYGNA|nr:clarin-2 [Pygocentrus nattereri]